MSYPKLIIAKFRANNVSEEETLVNNLNYICDEIYIYPSIEHLKDNETYKRLYKLKKKTDNEYYKFINNNR